MADQAADKYSTNHVCAISYHMLSTRNWWGNHNEISAEVILGVPHDVCLKEGTALFYWWELSLFDATNSHRGPEERGASREDC